MSAFSDLSLKGSLSEYLQSLSSSVLKPGTGSH
jgi:hypothetical protein